MIDRIVAYPGGSRGLVLNIKKPWETGIYVKEITGLEPPDAEIFMTDDPYYGGSRFHNSHISKRDIGITFQYDWAVTTKARRMVESIFVSGRPMRLELYQGGVQTEISGYVETVETERFSNEVETEVHILCPDPYFYVFGDSGEVTKTIKTSTPIVASEPQDGFVVSTSSGNYGSGYDLYGRIRLGMFGDKPVGIEMDVSFVNTPPAKTEIVLRGTGHVPQSIVLSVDKMASAVGGISSLRSYRYSSVDGNRKSEVYTKTGTRKDGRFVFTKKDWMRVWQYNDDLEVLVTPGFGRVVDITITAKNQLLGL